MQLPREPRPGDNLDGAWGAQVVRYLRAITPRGGPGVRVAGSSGGTTFSAAPGGLAAVAAAHPFEVLDASTTGPAAAKVTVRFGQVNSVTPTTGGSAPDADPAPALTVVSGVVYLRVNLDVDGIVTSAEILSGATLPAQTETEGYLTLATVTVASDAVTAINQAVTHSLGHQLCGAAVHNFWGL